MILFLTRTVILCSLLHFLSQFQLGNTTIKYVSFHLLFRFPIVEPDPGHTKLRLARDGLEAIKRITTPIAAVAVSFTSIAVLVLYLYVYVCLLNINLYV